MKVLSVLALCLAAGTAFPAEELQAEAPKVPSEEDASQIVDGMPASLGQFPHQAILYVRGQFVCGGSLISSTRVLSAAHCGNNNDVFTIRLGSVDLQSGGMTIPSCKFEGHSGYNPSNAHSNDIAMIYLSQSVQFSSTIRPISLPSSGSFVGQPGTASGFGSSHMGGPQSEKLLYVNTQVISHAECKRTFSYINELSHICMSGSAGNVCSGDSGGPLTVQNTLVGVASFVHPNGCGMGNPAVFTRVTSYISWIKQRM